MSESVFVDTAACGDLDGIQGYLNDPDFPAAAINKIDKDGRSAFHYACLNDDVPLLTLLLDDIRVNVLLLSPNGDSALHMASLYAALEAMKLVFKDARIPISSQNKYGETPLHLCAGSGDKGAAKVSMIIERFFL
jgi:ankyrin repeat protein